MIITKTPYRISFFGGGSDYPEWFNKSDGEVISTTINKFLYISCRHLPHFFRHKYRIVYSKIENVKNYNQIKHNAVKQILKYYNINDGLEIHYDGDLPARSGMGSSSCFVVGLLHALMKLKKKKINSNILSNQSIYLERNLMHENVGFQDQIAASYGGFNLIKFSKSKFQVSKINCSIKFKQKLNRNLFLVYTGISRTAQKIANSYTNKLSNNKKENIKNILKIVDRAKKAINQNNCDDFGRLLHETWVEKRNLSKIVTTSKIDDFYNRGLKNGALGGKLLGAGGGGFLLFYVEGKKIPMFKRAFANNILVPINISDKGSEIIFYEK